ncbi:T9SS type B sorting domain-containing protein [Flavobacterium sp. RHBU_24]|uniref:T9SS type B sorting domain-containing protein n=1 Tax=Flavobacterium sp. RHBU_24 TaxID=3391185 RepID=UPI003984727D
MNTFSKTYIPSFRSVLIMLFFTMIPGLLSAQLADFTASASVTDESCAGSGGVTFTIDNATPGADFLYTIYSLPGMEIEYSGNNPVYNGLVSGEYTAVISASLGTESKTVTLNFTINDITSGLEYTLATESQNCAGGNSIIVTVVNGTASAYEIISVAPPQSSNVFTGLVNGTYNIRVFDECGQGFVTTFTAVFDPQEPIFESPIFETPVVGDCTTTTLTSNMSYPEGTAISYPLTIQYVIHPSDGSPDITDTQTFTGGDPSTVEFSYTFTFLPGVSYTYDINVTDGCGITVGPQGLVFDALPQVALTDVPLPCSDYYINLSAQGFHEPYSVHFVDTPPNFNPVDFNAGYLATYTDPSISFGGEGMPVPEGSYTVTIKDACNRVSEPFTLVIDEQVVVPAVVGRNNSCFSNYIRATVPDRQIVTATITDAPPEYGPVPDDVTALINSSGILVVNNVPVGDYLITLTDSCGDNYIDVPVTVSPYVPLGFSATPLSDCTISIGSVIVSSGNGDLVSLNMTAAPAGFTETLPYNVTALIDPDTGELYMDNLPAGNYTFTGLDVCDVTDTVTVTITGYEPGTGTPFTFTPLCNSFDINLTDNDVSSLTPTYWLQKEDPANPGQWGHPDTGVPYTEGTLPNNNNAVPLTNNQVNFNLQFFGNFRIIKSFESVGNGTAPKVCTEVLGDPFEYFYKVEIKNIYKLDCTTFPNGVYIDAEGLAPLRYYALDAVTLAVVVDNGTNNIFTNLPEGVYRFRVENDCGEQAIQLSDISILPDLVDAQTPGDIVFCAQPDEPLFQEIDLTQQNAAILGGVSPDLYSITYYTNQADADAGVNAIADPEHFTNTANPQTIYARMEQIYILVCPEVVSFELEVGESPGISVDETQYLCEVEGSLVLDAGSGYDAYLWSPNGETTQTITVTEPGEYSVEVRYINTNSFCPAEATIIVLPIPPPEIQDIETVDWTRDDNSFTVIMDNPSLYEYSIDNINFQQSNTFTGLPTGIYTVYVRDLQQCSMVSKRLHLLYYPNFFTPNGDSENENWRIEFSSAEPELRVFIYDRYGKLLTNFGPEDDGWDGTFNGSPLPATDYWFVVTRANGQVHKGHFSLLR